MIHEYLSVFIFSAALLSTAALLPFLFMSKIMVERLDKLFNAFILGVTSMLLLSISNFLRIMDPPILHKTVEGISIGIFMAAAAMVIKNSASFYVLLESQKQLDSVVKQKTNELHRKVRDLQNSRTAMIHILKDLDLSRKELEIHANDLEELQKVLADFNSELGLEELIEKIAPKARKMTGARYAALGMISRDKKTFERFIWAGLTKEERKRLNGSSTPNIKGIFRTIIKRKTPLLSNDVNGDARFKSISKNSPAFRSFLGVPIQFKGKSHAVVILAGKEGGFTREDATMMKAFSQGAAAAIENARLYSDLEEAYTELLGIDRLKTDIISNVSHELRTPITIAKTSLELVYDEESKEGQSNFIKMADNALTRLNDIVEDLIIASDAHSGIHKLQLKDLSLHEELLRFLSRPEKWAARKKVVLKTLFPTRLPLVRADPEALRRVMENIVGNAIKFTDGEEGEVVISAMTEDSKVRLSINDNGVGIPKEKLNAIFAPLYQLDPTTTRAYGGTGMGLAVARSIVNSHRGKIWAESLVGKGTTIHFTLPVSKSEMAKE